MASSITEQEYEAAKRKLQRADGTPLYSPAEQREQEAALRSKYVSEIQDSSHCCPGRTLPHSGR
jgi:hypothetical protein